MTETALRKPAREAAPEPVANTRRLHVMTWGCQMNEYDSARMADLLTPHGFGETERAAEADLVILNPCHIREHATEKVFSELGRLRQIKEGRAAEGRSTLIALAGCVAQAEGEEILRRAPYVDLVIGPQAYHRLPELIEARRAGGPVIATDFPAESKFDALPQNGKARRARRVSAFLTIQEGCDKFCTFCVVPYTRGAEVSRPARSILEEAKTLLAQGVREIVLLGQNVNAWEGEGLNGRPWRLARLIEELAKLDGLLRLRYTTSHPRDMDEALIAAHRDIPALAPFLHLPVQSGSDRVLAAMNRRHRAADYLRLIERLRAARPDLALSSDFIVGFPGETRADFEATLALAREVGFAQAYSFKYSARPGTPAAEASDQVPEAEKAARLAELQALLAESQRAFNQASVGARLPVLFTGPGRHPGQIAGRSPYQQAVHAEGPAALIGELAFVTIAAAEAHSLRGRLHPDAVS